MAQTALFARTGGRFAVGDVIDWYVRRRGSLTVSQLVELFETDHEAKVLPSVMRFAIQRSSMTFDAERDMALLPDGMTLLDEGPELLPEATSKAATGATEPAAPAAEPEVEVAVAPETETAPEAVAVPADEEALARIAEVEEELAQVNASLAEKERLHQEYRELGRKIPALEDEVRSYGFFRRDERQEAQSRLNKARARYDSLKGEGSGMGTLRRRAEMLHNELNELRSKLRDR